MPKVYLTIDDSPCETTDALVDFLEERNIPALFFVRSDQMEINGEAIIRAIQKGFVIGNHSHTHKPAGDLGFEKWTQDFERCEGLINAAYKSARQQRPGLYYRFPYIDRGDGERVERSLASGGRGEFQENEKTLELQAYLKSKGFIQPFDNMPENYPSEAADCLFTYTSADWMLTDRHKGKWGCKTLTDLKTRIDEDRGLKNEPYNHVILMHDQAEIFDEVCALIDYFCEKGFEFLDF